jgi:hypothetical protein
MVKILFKSKTENINDIIKSLNNIRNIYTKVVSENSAEIEMPENYFEAISHTLEYWGNFTNI